MRAARESDVQRTCLAWLLLWGAVAVRVNSGALKVADRFVRFNSAAGCSDTLACLPGGRFLALEFKRPGRDRTPAKRRAEQAAFREGIVKVGGLALEVRSLDELLAGLRAAGFDTRTRV